MGKRYPYVFCSLVLALLSLPLGPTLVVCAEAVGGLRAEIVAVRIPADRRLAVTFKIADFKGQPLEFFELDRDSLRFTVAAMVANKNGGRGLHNFILTKVAGKEYSYKGETRKPILADSLQPDFDRGGAVARVAPGKFTYFFRTALPSNYDRDATHIVGGELSRGDGKYVANPLYEFVPAGGGVKVQRNPVETAACNSCHDPLRYHEGRRREAGYCVLCHTSQLTDPESGATLDFKVLVHKIHRGKLLTSVKTGKPYFVVGDGQQVADYTNLRYPQVVSTEGTVKDLRNCQACHLNSAQNENWKTFPATAPCVACHDHVDLTTGKNHLAGPQADGTCVGCHQAEGPEFGPSIAGAHMFPGNSAQLQGIVFDILKIEGTQPGQNPAVTFSVKTKHGEPLNAGRMNNLRLVIAWPTTDYKIAREEDARKAEPLGNGVYVHKFKYTLPAEAEGSGAVAIQGFKNGEVTKPNGSVIKNVRDVGYNVVKYFAITDRDAVPRRQAVKIENCNGCHGRLATHGESRLNTEFCVMCHNPSQNDGDKRKAAGGPLPPESIHFKRLIHRIHTGDQLGESFIVYGGPPAKPGAIDFSDIRFPGDRKNCVKCHVPGANEPPLPAGLLPTLIPQSDGSVRSVQPITSACGGCHTKETAKAHMDTLTTSNGQESCVVCHGVGREFSVEKVHRR